MEVSKVTKISIPFCWREQRPKLEISQHSSASKSCPSYHCKVQIVSVDEALSSLLKSPHLGKSRVIFIAEDEGVGSRVQGGRKGSS